MVLRQLRTQVTKVLAASATKIALGLGLVAIAPGLVTAMPTDSANTYLFGTTPEPGQIGHDYMVVQVDDENQLKGAMYQIQSEYACFSGEMSQGKMNLVIVPPYEQVAYAHTMDYSESSVVASDNGVVETQFVPEGFHPIEMVSTQANNILANCVTEAPLTI